jgi:hypothetical protein
MVATKTSGSFDGSNLASCQAGLAQAFADAGYPTPFQNYTESTPYQLIYQFTNGTGTYANSFHRYSLLSTAATQIYFNNISAMTGWDATTRTGTNQGAFPTWNASNLATSSVAYTSYAHDGGDYGFTLLTVDTLDSVIWGFGFVKLKSPLAGFSENIIPSTFLASMMVGSSPNSVFTATNAQWNLISSGLQYGGDGIGVDPLVYNPIPYALKSPWSVNSTVKYTPLMNNSNGVSGYSLITPIPLYNAGAVTGTAHPDLCQGPLVGANAFGDRIVVSLGVEEYEHIAGALYLRVV